MKERLRRVIEELKSIDDELDNEICLVATEDEEDEPITEFTFWGIADMIEEFLENGLDK